MTLRTNHIAIRAVAVALTAALLSACAMSDDQLARTLVAPGKFTLYACPDLEKRVQELGMRRRALEGLIAKAGQGSDGRLVSALAYRPDYLATRGEIQELREAATEKHCDMAAIEKAAITPIPEDDEEAPAEADKRS